MDIWDFQRHKEGRPGFDISQRRIGPDSYRLLGEGVFSQLEDPPEKYHLEPSLPPPPPSFNAFNSSVKVLLAESGPAPWEAAGPRYKKLFILGEVAAGRYDVTVAYYESGSGPDADFVLVDPSRLKLGNQTFALRVRGTSMIENGIENGDVILVQAQDWADDGDFVIACLAGSSDPLGFVTLKRFYRNRVPGRVVLQPANQSLSPIHILPLKGNPRQDDLDGVKIQGKVTAIIKNAGLV